MQIPLSSQHGPPKCIVPRVRLSSREVFGESNLVAPVKLARMSGSQQSSPRRALFVFAVAATIAFLLLFSLTLASSDGSGFYHLTLDLPVFFLLLVLTGCTDDWAQAEDTFFPLRPLPPLLPPEHRLLHSFRDIR